MQVATETCSCCGSTDNHALIVCHNCRNKWEPSQPYTSEIQLPKCGICGGATVEIRGRNPQEPNRFVCPTCTYERLERISEISNEHFGQTCRVKDAPPKKLEI